MFPLESPWKCNSAMTLNLSGILKTMAWILLILEIKPTMLKGKEWLVQVNRPHWGGGNIYIHSLACEFIQLAFTEYVFHAQKSAMPWGDRKEKHRGEYNVGHDGVDTLQTVMWFNTGKFQVLNTLMQRDELWSLQGFGSVRQAILCAHCIRM